MMPAQSGSDRYLQTRDRFCNRLISQAGVAYKSLYTKKIREEEFYRDDSEVIFSDVHSVRQIAVNALRLYYLAFIELHRNYLDSQQTSQQIKRQAKSFLKTYRGEEGNQERFERAFALYLRQLMQGPNLRFQEADYAPDSSDDEAPSSEEIQQETSVRPSTIQRSSSCFFGLPSFEPIQLDRKPSLNQSMLDSIAVRHGRP